MWEKVWICVFTWIKIYGSAASTMIALWNFEVAVEWTETRKKFSISTPQMLQEQNIFLALYNFRVTTDKSANGLCSSCYYYSF